MTKNENMYDFKAKKILSDKQVLVNLLKEVVQEYRDISKDEIYSLIENGSKERYINGINTNNIKIGDGEVNFDILFTSKLPDSNENIGMYINIEPQGYSTNYPIIKRAIYYVSRLISRQKGIEFKGQDYQKLKKVYSIWITAPSDKRLYNTVKKFRLIDEDMIGEYTIDKTDYDLMDITIFNLSDNDESNVNALNLLKLFFANLNLSSKQISERLKKEYNIEYSEQEVKDMGSFSEVIKHSAYQQGIEQGIAQGIEQGIAQGKIDSSIEIIQSLINNGISIDEAFRLTGISQDLKETILKEFDK